MKRQYGTGSIRFKDASFHFTIRLNGRKKTFLLRAGNEDDAQIEANEILRRFQVLSEIETKEDLALFVKKGKKLLADNKKFCIEDGFERLIFCSVPDIEGHSVANRHSTVRMVLLIVNQHLPFQ